MCFSGSDQQLFSIFLDTNFSLLYLVLIKYLFRTTNYLIQRYIILDVNDQVSSCMGPVYRLESLYICVLIQPLALENFKVYVGQGYQTS